VGGGCGCERSVHYVVPNPTIHSPMHPVYTLLILLPSHMRSAPQHSRACCVMCPCTVGGACITLCLSPSIHTHTMYAHCVYSCLHTCVQHHSTQEHVVSCAIPCMHCGRSVHYVVFEPFHSYTHHVCTLRIPLPFTHGHTVCRTGPYLAMKGCLRYVVFRSPSFTRTQTHAHTLYTLLCHQASSPHPMLCVLCSHTQAL